MSLQPGELQTVLRKFDQIQKSITDRKTLRKVMRKPADIVAENARPRIPRSKRIHYRYNTAKLIKSRRARKGLGRIVAAYVPGNLRKAIKRLTFRRSARQFVGPKLAKRGKASGVFGLNNTKVDGYYAQFLSGSRAAFRKQFMESALSASAGKALEAAEQALDKEIAKAKQKTGL